MAYDLGWDGLLWVPGEQEKLKPMRTAVSRFIGLTMTGMAFVAEMPIESLVLLRRSMCFTTEDVLFSLNGPGFPQGVHLLSGLGKSGNLCSEGLIVGSDPMVLCNISRSNG